MTRSFIALVKADMVNFSRSRIALFWTVAFPLLVLFAYMQLFAGAQLGQVDLVIKDYDKTAQSRDLTDSIIGILRHQDVVEIVRLPRASKDKTKRQIVMVIPERFADASAQGQTTLINIAASDASDPAVKATMGIMRSAVSTWNLAVSGEKQRAELFVAPSAAGAVHSARVDFIVAGLIVMIALSSALMGFAVPLTAAREFGLTRQQSLWPVDRRTILGAWAVSKLLIILGSTFILCLIARLQFGFGHDISFAGIVQGIVIIILATMCMLAIGLAIAARTKSTQTALVIANILYFVGLFTGDLIIPTGGLPAGLKTVLTMSPVNSFAHAIRASLAQSGAWFNFAPIIMPIIIFIVVGGAAFAFAVRNYQWSNR